MITERKQIPVPSGMYEPWMLAGSEDEPGIVDFIMTCCFDERFLWKEMRSYAIILTELFIRGGDQSVEKRHIEDKHTDPFAEYFVLGEPDRADKAYAWQTAVGLQDVDRLTLS